MRDVTLTIVMQLGMPRKFLNIWHLWILKKNPLPGFEYKSFCQVRKKLRKFSRVRNPINSWQLLFLWSHFFAPKWCDCDVTSTRHECSRRKIFVLSRVRTSCHVSPQKGENFIYEFQLCTCLWCVLLYVLHDVSGNKQYQISGLLKINIYLLFFSNLIFTTTLLNIKLLHYLHIPLSWLRLLDVEFYTLIIGKRITSPTLFPTKSGW